VLRHGFLGSSCVHFVALSFCLFITVYSKLIYKHLGFWFQLVSVTHRAIRRRCLDFEMANVQRKNSEDNSNAGSSTSESDERNVANEKQLLPAKLNGNFQRGILQGIGLHLNALAALKEYKGIQIENLSSGRQLSLPNSTSLQISTSQEHQHLSLVPVSSERELDSSENGLQPAEDCSQPSVYMAGEDFNKNSPRKKKQVQFLISCVSCYSEFFLSSLVLYQV